MSKIQTGLYAVFWNDILGQVNKISEILQNPRLDVNTAVLALKSLRSFIGTTRDSFEEYFVKVAELDDFVEYDSETQRKRKINVRLSPLDSVQIPEIEMSSSNKFRIQSFLPVIDQLESSLQQRLEAYELVDNRFGFIYKLDILDDKKIIITAQNLVKLYDNDLDD
ncbi:uncharacterized protein LOC112683847 isoform X1 [Sipha flava]|uniref:Uncharacterized protein LOC112683847 isoform X1 n=1 Tax=Sipha flava TaxID=143950 RepID=A0A2S2QVF0_9HEMI|nr:uncharacterized protein LOC112683847 isoform X1 [Sipha flava]XP_025410808.1 uncharacterized protein LOC112683847 isoform X1 [Sipha flava]